MHAITAWMAQAEATRRIIDENYGGLTGEARMNVAVQENVLVQIENLQTHPSVRTRLWRGKFTLIAWVYKFETGQVFAYSTDERGFLPVSDDPRTHGTRTVPNFATESPS